MTFLVNTNLGTVRVREGLGYRLLRATDEDALLEALALIADAAGIDVGGAELVPELEYVPEP